MVNPWDLANDVIGAIGSLVLTPLIWAGLFLWAWSRPAEARESGFGRMTFWLLIPGALFASLADAPFLPWAGNVVAVNLGGALIPILLTLVLLHRTLAQPGWVLTAMTVLFVAAETAGQFGIVLTAGALLAPILVAAIAGGTVVIAAVILPMAAPPPQARRAITFVGLTSAAIPLTFLTSQAVPGVGIVSVFPLYLIGPSVVGLAAVWLAPMLWALPSYRGLGVGFGAGTLGTLIGADVLREPPLYSGGGGALLAVGGAGVLDLVYFSGLLAVGIGLLFVAVTSRRTAPAAIPAPGEEVRTPEERLTSAAGRLAAGDWTGAVRDARDASRSSGDRARTIWQAPSAATAAGAWEGLPVAPYVGYDYRNLASSGDQPVPSQREATRSVVMATLLVRLGRDLTRLRFAAPSRRAWAVLADLAIVTGPAVVLWVYLALTLPGSIDSILTGLPFNLAVFAYVAYAVLYLVLFDAVFGATLGKRLMHLRVTDRNLARPTVLQSFLRESPKTVPLYVIGEFGAPSLLLVIRASSSTFSAFGVSLALFTGAALLGLVVLSVGLALSIGGVQVSRDSERQRLGDRWADTWVIDRRVVSPAWGARLGTAPVPPEGAPPG